MLTINNFASGEGKSKYDTNGFDATANLDVHSTLGEAQCQLALASETTAVNENCVFAVAPTGTLYAFSKSSTKIWKRSTAGSWSAVTANTNSGGHKGARYYNGFIYYATASKLGRFVADTEGSKNDSFGTFTNSSIYKPMTELNLTLFIGDGKYVASVNSSGTFNANALDVPVNYSVSALIDDGTALLVGTFINAYVSSCKVFSWDTFSDSWTTEDTLDEIGVNSFLKADNIIFAQCGTSGNFYYWTGQNMEKFGKIRGLTTTQGDQMVAVVAGKPLFANLTKVYSLHREDKDLPYAVVHEYTAPATISAIAAVGTQLLVSYGTGVAKIGTNYATATLDTYEIQEPFKGVQVRYGALPTGTAIGISTKIDGGDYTAQTAVTDTVKKTISFNGGLGTVNYGQVRVTLTPSGATTPKIKSIELF